MLRLLTTIALIYVVVLVVVIDVLLVAPAFCISIESAAPPDEDESLRATPRRVTFSWDSDDDRRRCGPEQRRHGRVRFCYRDRDYRSVAIAGTFNDWQPEPMRFDEDEGIWYVTLRLSERRHYYQFVVEDDWEVWTALDPENPQAKRTEEHGWVSVIDLRDEGRDEDRDEDRGWYRRRSWRSRTPARLELERAYGQEEIEVSYQRVDGLSLFMKPQHYGHGSFEPSIKGRFGFGFKSDEWSLGATIVQPLEPAGKLMLKLSGYARTDFTDQNGVGDAENTLAAVFFKEDYRDYYRREGLTASLVFAERGIAHLEAGLSVDDYASLDNQADWSFSAGDFRPNPPVDEGTMRTLFARAALGDEDNQLRIAYERSDPGILSSGYEFSRLSGEYRGRLRLGFRQYLLFRASGGSGLSGSLPVQKRFVMGGIGTVRGYLFQSLLEPSPDVARDPGDPLPLGGERFALGTVEYGFRIFADLDVALFYDTGMAWERRGDDMDASDLKHSIGIGLLADDADEGLRLDLIQTLDDDDHDILAQFRIKRAF